MASLYKRPDSPFYWASFLDLTGRRRQKSTGLRHAIPADTRKAHELCRELSAAEVHRVADDEHWDRWVPRFLDQRYDAHSRTYARMTTSWRSVSAFLRAKGVAIPRQLTRQHLRDYIGWRAVPHEGTYVARRNTALNEMKLLGMVMREAVQSGFATVNPCDRLGISREASKKKPRITDAEHQRILAALKHEDEWMRTAYLIAWEQGCRLSETVLPLDDIDLDRGVIRFRTKGHKNEPAEFPLSPRLIPMITRMKSDGRRMTFVMPEGGAQLFWRFFRRIGLPHLTFHCLRVTFITRAYEAGIQRTDVMRLVSHSSYAAHAVYPRLTADHSTAQAMRALL